MTALQLLFGIFFAWETRKVRIEALNDSRQVGVCVYNVVLLSVIAVSLVQLLSLQQEDIIYAIVAIAIFLSATTTLLLIFGTKVMVTEFLLIGLG